MKKTALLTAIAAAAALASGTVSADTSNTATQEQCKIVQAGKGMILAGKSDCKATSHSCAGKNTSGDPDSWIWVPKGQCVKVNQGDFSGIPMDVQEKIEGTDASGATIG